MFYFYINGNIKTASVRNERWRFGSFLHLGQNGGNLISTVSAYTFVRVLLPHIRQDRYIGTGSINDKLSSIRSALGIGLHGEIAYCQDHST